LELGTIESNNCLRRLMYEFGTPGLGGRLTKVEPFPTTQLKFN